MEVKPLAATRRRKTRPVALIHAAGPARLLVLTEDGERHEVGGRERCRALLRSLTGWQVYTTTAPTAVLVATGATHWTGRSWQGALVSLKLDGGPTVTPLRKMLAAYPPDEAMGGLLRALAWLATFGVVPASLSSMAWQLWRASLDREVRLWGPPIREALYGGRQEAPFPGEYRAANYYDLGAAYPSSMASEPYPLRLAQVSPTTDFRHGDGLARARVRLPEMAWGPLPVRIGPEVVCYGHGTAEGWWPWRELAMAERAGAEVSVVESHAAMRSGDLFGPWWKLAAPGRLLGGAAAKLAKAVTSSLWGQFALSGEGGRMVRWADEWARHAVIVPEQPRPMPHRFTVHIAAETAARVRVRLYEEGLSLPDAIYCDTDAVIAGTDHTPQPFGQGPGLWSAKLGQVTNLDIRAPQVMRYGCVGCGDDHPQWHYVVAGASTPDLAERIFRREYRRHATVRIGPGGTTLPNMALDRARASMTRERGTLNAA